MASSGDCTRPLGRRHFDIEFTTPHGIAAASSGLPCTPGKSLCTCQVAKNVEAGRAQVVFLAESCNEATYKKLIQASRNCVVSGSHLHLRVPRLQGLCLEKNVPLIDVPDNKSLGEWAGWSALGFYR